MLGAAVSAADEERYCDALYLFDALHLRSPTPRALFNAAEVAYAAGDRVKALDLFRLTQQRYPTFEKSKLVQSRVNTVFTDMVRQGPGTACPVRADVCGDWRFVSVATGGEQCDDGNLQSGDGCDANCTPTSCGNGIMTVGEQCDDGNATNGDGCDTNCTYSACGNGVRGPTETCDDGNLADNDGCDHTCKPTSCGNGVTTGNEECDDGNDVNGDGCDSGCRLSGCGNNIVTGLEQCDDGNAVNGDGCESNCSRTQVHRPLPGIIASVVSAAAVAGGSIIGWTGYSTVDQSRAAVAAVDDAEQSYAADPNASLEGIDTARDNATAASVAAATFGMPMFVGGVGLAAAGVVGLGYGVWLALTNTEDGGAQ